MKVLLWMSVGFDRRTPSGHLLADIVGALYRQGHTVHILQKDTGGPLPGLPASIAGLGVTTEGVPCRPVGKRRFAARYLSDAAYVMKCWRRIRRQKDCGAVFLQSGNTAGLAAFLVRLTLPRVRLTYNVQDIFPENAVCCGLLKRDGVLHRLLAAEQRYAYRRADRLITISEDMRAQLILCGAPEDRIEVIYNWTCQDEPFDIPEAERGVVREMFPRDRFHVVYAGNTGMMQGVELLVHTAALMRDEPGVCFHIVGDGVYKEKLTALAEALQTENLFFWDMLPSSLAPALYCMAGLNVVPLARDIYRTALPSKTAACLACGRPMVLAVGRESQFGQTAAREAGCILTDSGDAEALRDAIRRVRSGGFDGREAAQAFFARHMRSSVNSGRYAGCITGGIPEEGTWA